MIIDYNQINVILDSANPPFKAYEAIPQKLTNILNIYTMDKTCNFVKCVKESLKC
jgi:hypothetical protein